MMWLIDVDAFAAEMKERQDKAEKWLRESKDHETATRADAVLSFIYEVKLTLDKMPIVDAVPVVRCRDCIHNYANMVPGGEGCAKCTELPIAPDFFCKSGERKVGDK